MQSKIYDVIDTRELIKSFQWDSQQAFEQHDIQEFCRVLFDAIEQNISCSTNENFISELYEGTSIN